MTSPNRDERSMKCFSGGVLNRSEFAFAPGKLLGSPCPPALILLALMILLLPLQILGQDSTREDPLNLLFEQTREHTLQNRFDQAGTLLEQALEDCLNRQDRLCEGRVLVEQATLWNASGAPQQSLNALHGAAQVFEDLGEKEELAFALRQLGQYSGDHASLRRASELYRELGQPLSVAEVEAARALSLLRSESWSEAVRIARSAREKLEGTDRLAALRGALAAEAYGLYQQGFFREALPLYDRIIDVAFLKGHQAAIYSAYCNRAEVKRRLGQGGGALEDLKLAIAGFEAARVNIPVGGRRAAYLAPQGSAWERLVVVLLDSWQKEEAFRVAERFHARLFLDLISERELGPESSFAQRDLLAALGQSRLALQTNPGRNDIERRIRELETVLADHQHQNRRSDERWRQALLLEPTNEEDIQGALQLGEVFVSYWVAEDRIIAWTIDSEGLHLSQIPITRKRLEEVIWAYLEPLRFASRAADQEMRGEQEAHLANGQLLYRWLLGSLPASVQQADTLLVVPDGLLHRLPLEALVSSCKASESSAAIHGAYRHCQYAGLEQGFAYLSSGTALVRERRSAPPDPQQGLLALAPSFEIDNEVSSEGIRRSLLDLHPLQGAAEEVQALPKLFGQGEKWLQNQASESRFKQSAGQFAYIHLATHGLVVDDLPMTSGLLLGEGQGEDGLLQAWEVLDLELEAELVTLSACRSGRGRLHRGAGVVGLSQAFLLAGARRVMVSGWDVDDRSTSWYMETFYRALMEGESAPRAALAARRDLFERRGEQRLAFKVRPMTYAHPRFWSAFVLIGAP